MKESVKTTSLLPGGLLARDGDSPTPEEPLIGTGTRDTSERRDDSLPLDHIVAALRNSRESTHNVRHRGSVRELPSRTAIGDTMEALAAALFPTHYGRTDLTDRDIDFFVGATLSNALRVLNEQIRRGLLFTEDAQPDPETCRIRAGEITETFAEQLATIRALLVSDVRAAYAGDPAAASISEVLLCYPGTIAIIYHRIAHALWNLGAHFIARLISRISHSTTGIDIHPGARIGGSFFIDHGTGVVIGQTAIIGEHVRLYQHVTLGAKRFPEDDSGALIKGIPRHPIVEDGVVIYAGATILGRITIGRNSTIGGNVWLTHSVPENSNIAQARMRND
ncbi:serine O-acetyltransferase EpsC [Robbsia andropogonis]|uniref:serine O-acetyltransferase EpsC n=1 Tax=Robbsia andropogonis TaxID=28092 RepID=UPI000465BE26|nr:serine O-acetyltransferase EpsC [Robbsia andropogonis]